MKKPIRNLYRMLFKKWFEIVFYINIRKLNRDDKVYIFDIDNTIANTWPSFLQGYPTIRIRLSSLAIFYNMRHYIKRIKKHGYKVVYITSRPYYTYDITYKWLKQNGLIDNILDLILVEKPSDKIFFLLKIPQNIEVILFDDMTYNHEKGYKKYYEEEINLIRRIPNVKYCGEKEIMRIINGEYII